MRKILLITVIVGLLLTVLPAVTASAAPPLGPFDRLRAAPRDSRSDGLEAPLAQGSLFAKVAGLWIQLYEDFQLQTLGAKVRQGTFLEIGESSGNARHVQAFTLRPQVIQGELVTTRIDVAKGWADAYLFTTGQVVFLSGAFLPPEFTVGAARGMQGLSNCQIWLECNGYRTVGTGRIARLLDQSGILTAHPEDCKPFWGKPRPRGCYP